MRLGSLRKALLPAGTLALVALGAGCAHFPGPPSHGAEDVRPDEVAQFSKLYGENCAACHGTNGNNAPSMAFNNPVYEALIPDDELHNVIANGRGNSPAFAQSAGGMLTDKQISIIMYGMRQHWAKPGFLDNANAPAYAAHLTANTEHGQQVFTTACASCHGNAQKPLAGGNLTDPTYLSLVSDQYLRSVTIAGRPDVNQPDWRADGAQHPLPGYPLSDQDVTDVVGWIASFRPAPPGGAETAKLQAKVNQNPSAGLHPGTSPQAGKDKTRPLGAVTSGLQKRRSQ